MDNRHFSPVHCDKGTNTEQFNVSSISSQDNSLTNSVITSENGQNGSQRNNGSSELLDAEAGNLDTPFCSTGRSSAFERVHPKDVTGTGIVKSDSYDMFNDSEMEKHSQKTQSSSTLDRLTPRAMSPSLEKSVYLKANNSSGTVIPMKDKERQTSFRKTRSDSESSRGSCSQYSPDAARFLQANDTSDLRLIVEGKPLYVSRIVLSIISPVLKRMFDIRSRETSIVEIPLPDKNFDEMLEFLCVVYPDRLKPITDKNIVQLLVLAEDLQVSSLKTRCEDYLLKELKRGQSFVSPEHLIFNMQLAEKYSLESVQKQCFEIATRTSTEVLESVQGFWDMSHVTTSSIFLHRLKLFEQASKKIAKRLNESETHCNLYHKNERWGDNLCNKCLASVGKIAATEITQL